MRIKSGIFIEEQVRAKLGKVLGYANCNVRGLKLFCKLKIAGLVDPSARLKANNKLYMYFKFWRHNLVAHYFQH